jgi:antitoxin HigA-1
LTIVRHEYYVICSTEIEEMASTKKPAVAPHPGTVLLETYMKPRGINPHRLSLELRIPANRIGAIVHGQRAISPDTALRLSRFFCTTPEYWLDLQSAYDLDRARNDAGEAIAKDVKDGCGQGKAPRK